DQLEKRHGVLSRNSFSKPRDEGSYVPTLGTGGRRALHHATISRHSPRQNKAGERKAARKSRNQIRCLRIKPTFRARGTCSRSRGKEPTRLAARFRSARIRWRLLTCAVSNLPESKASTF